MVVRLSRSAIEAGKRRRASACVVRIPDHISELVAIRGVQNEIARLIRQADARHDNLGRVRAMARDLYRKQQAFERKHGCWPHTPN